MINLIEIKNKIFKKENIYFFIIILFTFFLDRYSKIKIIDNFSDSIYFVNNFLNINLVWNSGIGFGLFSTSSIFFYNLTSFLIGVIILILLFTAFSLDKNEKIIFSIIIGGAVGNFYDRILFNAVPDFIDFHYNNLHWFTFNVADVLITVGIISFVIKGFFVKNSK